MKTLKIDVEKLRIQAEIIGGLIEGYKPPVKDNVEGVWNFLEELLDEADKREEAVVVVFDYPLCKK